MSGNNMSEFKINYVADDGRSGCVHIKADDVCAAVCMVIDGADLHDAMLQLNVRPLHIEGKDDRHGLVELPPEVLSAVGLARALLDDEEDST